MSCTNSTPCFVAQTKEVLAPAHAHPSGVRFLEKGEGEQNLTTDAVRRY